MFHFAIELQPTFYIWLLFLRLGNKKTLKHCLLKKIRHISKLSFDQLGISKQHSCQSLVLCLIRVQTELQMATFNTTLIRTFTYIRDGRDHLRE
jgi:hypothetical protein